MTSFESFLPLIFASLMGLSMLIYAVLDGYDLGVGMLMARADADQRDRMIASIGPFWDANETWLVLGVGLLLVAFPVAHGVILSALYLPVAAMLFGLILRGVSFDFRAKAHTRHRRAWNRAFIAGSALTAFAQGAMLGSYILGFEQSLAALGFSILAGLSVMAGYALIGACWLIMKTEGELQRRAIAWARNSLWLMAGGIVLVSAATPLVSSRIFDKWFSFPNIVLLAPIPVMTGALVLAMAWLLHHLPRPKDALCWMPFAMTVAIYILCFHGLAYSFYPYIVPDRLTIDEAASAPESLMIIFAGAAVVLPVLVGYTVFAYKVFHGKASDLKYD